MNLRFEELLIVGEFFQLPRIAVVLRIELLDGALIGKPAKEKLRLLITLRPIALNKVKTRCAECHRSDDDQHQRKGVARRSGWLRSSHHELPSRPRAAHSRKAANPCTALIRTFQLRSPPVSAALPFPSCRKPAKWDGGCARQRLPGIESTQVLMPLRQPWKRLLSRS